MFVGILLIVDLEYCFSFVTWCKIWFAYGVGVWFGVACCFCFDLSDFTCSLCFDCVCFDVLGVLMCW